VYGYVYGCVLQVHARVNNTVHRIVQKFGEVILEVAPAQELPQAQQQGRDEASAPAVEGAGQ
jgi:hypothetical protein